MALGLQSLVLLSLLVIRLTYFPDSGAKSNSSGCGNAHTKAVIVSLWRMTPHLRPKLHRCPHHTLPNGFWLLLLAGDVELNPGPVRFPCTVCQKPVKCNQRGIQCSICDNWTHAKCEVSLLKSMWDWEKERMSPGYALTVWPESCHSRMQVWPQLVTITREVHHLELMSSVQLWAC